jgi:hypothetical protein
MLVTIAAYEIYALRIASQRDALAIVIDLAFLVTLRRYRLHKLRETILINAIEVIL